MSISLLIPTYRNPEYLDICLRSAIENQTHKNEIIVAVDGYYEESKDILEKYNNSNEDISNILCESTKFSSFWNDILIKNEILKK